MKNGKKLIYFDYKDVVLNGESGTLYVCEKFTETQRREIQHIAPFVQFMKLQREYAPELVSGCVWVPDWAYRNTTVFYYLFAGDETWDWDYEGMGQTTIFDMLEV